MIVSALEYVSTDAIDASDRVRSSTKSFVESSVLGSLLDLLSLLLLEALLLLLLVLVLNLLRTGIFEDVDNTCVGVPFVELLSPEFCLINGRFIMDFGCEYVSVVASLPLFSSCFSSVEIKIFVSLGVSICAATRHGFCSSMRNFLRFIVEYKFSLLPGNSGPTCRAAISMVSGSSDGDSGIGSAITGINGHGSPRFTPSECRPIRSSVDVVRGGGTGGGLAYVFIMC